MKMYDQLQQNHIVKYVLENKIEYDSYSQISTAALCNPNYCVIEKLRQPRCFKRTRNNWPNSDEAVLCYAC